MVAAGCVGLSSVFIYGLAVDHWYTQIPCRCRLEILDKGSHVFILHWALQMT